MKILYVTPFIKTSAIGRFSIFVTDELARRGHEVRIIASESSRTPLSSRHPSNLPVTHWADANSEGVVEGCDIAIMNVGDYPLFHRSIFRFLDAIPSIGIFHDFFCYNLYTDWLKTQRVGAAAHDRGIVRTYGPAQAPAAVAAREGRIDLGGIADSIPMTEWIAGRCVGAIAHSTFYVDRLEASCPGPVATAPLCWPSRPSDPPEHRPGDKLVIATMGIIGPNKCCDVVIRAIAGSPVLRSAVDYHLLGKVERSEHARLKGLVEAHGLDNVHFFGELNDDDYKRRLKDVDVICCLRRPHFEGASATCIEGMQSGRPTIVVDTGFYHDLPDDLVFKLPADFGPDELSPVLEKLARNARLRQTTGRKARAWANQQFTASRYVDILEPVLTTALEALPLMKLGAQFGRQLAALGVPQDDPIVGRIARNLEALGAHADA